MCRTNPMGQRWATLNAIGEYATLQWPTIEARLAKRKTSQPAKSVGGKRKASGGGSGRSSKAKLSAALTDEQYANDIENRLCHNCHKQDHIARDCEEGPPSNNKGKAQKKGKKSEKGFQKD